MKRIFIISASAVLIVAFTASATIINIPADYPTIQQGINASINGDTVLVQPGLYGRINFNGRNIVLGSLFLITGEEIYKGVTQIWGDSLAEAVITFSNGEDNSTVITGFTIKYGKWGIICNNSSPQINNNIITSNIHQTESGGAEGGGIKCENSGAIIESNYIFYNGAESYDSMPNLVLGYGIFADNLDLVIKNNRIGGIFANSSYWNEAYGILAGNGSLIVNSEIMSVIAGPTIWDYAYGLACGSCEVVNSIIRYNKVNIRSGATQITYSNIEGGWEGIGNINADPLFRNPGNADFHLMSTACGDPYDSPCIDAGDPNIVDSLLDCSWGLGGTRSDMGAYGGGDSIAVGIFENIAALPHRFMLFQNYPNPFNTQTTIEFIIPKSQHVNLTVYDLLGRQIEILLDEYKQAGIHTVVLDASHLSSGVYFYRLQAGEMAETRRMVLLK